MTERFVSPSWLANWEANPEALAARRWQGCTHEAGHVLMGFLLGMPPEQVSVRPAEGFGGICFYGSDVVPTDPGQPWPPVCAQPRELRDWSERHVLVSLAGPRAALMTGEAPTGRVPDTSFAERAAVALDHLSPRGRELQVSAERETEPPPSDEETADRLSALINGVSAAEGPTSRRVAAHVNWLRLECDAMLERHAPQLTALAEALAEHVILTRLELEAILRAAPPCGCHTWPAETEANCD